MRHYVLLVALLASLLAPPLASASHLSLAWDAPYINADGSGLNDLAGYRIYYGLASTGAYAPPCNSYYLDVPNLTVFALSGLAEGGLYFVQITARDLSGNESTCSNEASAVAIGAPAAPPAPPVPPAYVPPVAPVESNWWSDFH
jgi:hypothetical protein